MAIPLVEDQPLNGYRIADELGLGVRLDFTTMNTNDIRKAIHTVLHDKSYDERMDSLPITGQTLVPNKQRYIDPVFEEDLREAIGTGKEWSVICARRALNLGFGWTSSLPLPRLRQTTLGRQRLLFGRTLSCDLPHQWCRQVHHQRRRCQAGFCEG